MCVVLGTTLTPLRPSLARSKSRTHGGKGSPLKLSLLCLMHVGKVQTVVKTFPWAQLSSKFSTAKPHGRLPGESGTQG